MRKSNQNMQTYCLVVTVVLSLSCLTLCSDTLYPQTYNPSRKIESSGLSLSISPSAGFIVQVDGVNWLQSDDIAVHLNDKWFSAVSGTLELIKTKSFKSSDPFFGEYNGQIFIWTADDVTVETTFKVYSEIEAIMFEIVFPQGANSTSLNTNADLLTTFPSFGKSFINLNYLTYNGMMAYPAVGKWSSKSIPGGINGGPVLLYDSNLRSLAISPFNNFMVAIQNYSDQIGGNWAYGIQGMVSNYPVGFTHQTLIFAGQGVSSTLYGWGDILLGFYGKQRRQSFGDYNDNEINYLGYWTDNGAYYYYNTEPSKNYQQTIIDVVSYLNQSGIPVQNLQLDSWWYYKGVNNGVYVWLPMPSVFPDGLNYVEDKINLPLTLHNRYFSPDTPYQKNYTMIVEDTIALPLDVNLFIELMSWAKKSGAIVYEQDWLITTYQYMNATQNNVTNSRTWLMTMGQAAEYTDMTIQYCMPLPMHLLQSVEIPRVTQSRASVDYNPGNDQWKVGYTSLFLWSLGLIPFKDDFWTTANQPGCSFSSCVEPNVVLETLVATLTSGPVGPSDKIGNIDKNLIMHTCAENGLLLNTGTPASPPDAIFRNTFSNPQIIEVWTSVVSYGGQDNFTWAYVFGAELSSPFTLKLTDLLPTTSSTSRYLVYDYFSITNTSVNNIQIFDLNNTLTIPTEGYSFGQVPFRYFVVVPFWESLNGWAVLGEVGKFITISPQRVVSILNSRVFFELSGAPNEIVRYALVNWNQSKNKLIWVNAVIDNKGFGYIACYQNGCTGSS